MANESKAKRPEPRKPVYERPVISSFSEEELAEVVEAYGASLPVIP